MNLKKLFYILFLNLFITLANAQSPEQELTTLLNSVQAMRANFTQTVFDDRGKAVQKSYGRMAMIRPGKFRWEVIKPIPQLVVANDTRLWIYDPDLDQVTIRSLKHAAGDTPALLLTNVEMVLQQDYVVKPLTKNSSTLRWFLLTPKNADNMFADIQLGFAQTQIKQMQLQDHLGHTTLIQFNNVEVNPQLANSLFTFKIPRNVDVIDETRQR